MFIQNSILNKNFLVVTIWPLHTVCLATTAKNFTEINNARKAIVFLNSEVPVDIAAVV